MTDETYNGWANRETWAFWLHVTNDQGWCEMVREDVETYLAGQEYAADYAGDADQSTWYTLGEHVVEYVREALEETLAVPFRDQGTLSAAYMMRDDIGSWWRIDYAEIGAAARELVAES